MSKLIMLRHGQSEWNRLNLFTGWVDIPLSSLGVQEALAAGEEIKNYMIDIVFTSELVRAKMTAMLALTKHSSGKIPVLLPHGESQRKDWANIYSEKTFEQCIPTIEAWELNERMYGKLQGLNKAETIEKYGIEQVQLWRRGYAIRPPDGESLEDTVARTIPYFASTIVPFLEKGKNVFIAAHGNSLRAIIMYLDSLTPDQVVHLELATGKPIIYNFNEGSFCPDTFDGKS